MTNNDQLQRFIFEQLGIRGEIVRLTASWQEVLARHTYPKAVQHTLGEMLAASTLLSSILKYEGAMILQIQGKGPLQLAVAECTSDKTVRGIAHYDESLSVDSFIELVGDGTLVITIDPTKGERYQGIVDLSSGNIVHALENYMHRSQQLTTWLWLFSNDEQCVGMLLQKLPDLKESNTFFEQSNGVASEIDSHKKGASPLSQMDSDAWSRVTQLANTVSKEEMLSLSFSKLVYRLFHEEEVRLFEPSPVSFRCSCSRDRVRGMLRMLGHEEVQSILVQESKIGVNCEFCNHYYEFDRVDAEQIFASLHTHDPSSTRH